MTPRRGTHGAAKRFLKRSSPSVRRVDRRTPPTEVKGRPSLAARLERALAPAPEGALAVGAGGRIVAWNRAAEVITGYTATQAIGRTCSELFPRDAHGNGVCDAGCPVAAVVDDPVKTVDVPTRNHAGHPIWLNMAAVSVPGNGEGALAVHLFRDVTATHKFLIRVRPALDASDDGGAVGPAGRDALTRRELEVLRLIGQGLDTAAAAERLHISRTTIRNHVQSILGKLAVHSRLQAVAYATRHRLL